jgi:Membrane domain of glycerophosphoryl diester phosphodiesterase
MDTHLRPMSLGEILDRTAQLYRSNFLLFCGIAAVYAGAVTALGLAHIGIQQLFIALHWTKQLLWLSGGVIVVQFLMQFALGGLAVAANNRAVAWAHLGQPATIRGAYKSILPRLRSFLWLITIVTFVLWTPIGIGYGGFAAVAFWIIPKTKSGAHLDPGTAMIAGLLFFLVAAVILAGFIYALLMWLRYALAIPAWVVEETKARPSLRRSIDLSRGSRGRIFILVLLVAAIELGLIIVSQGFFIILAFKSHWVLPTWALVAQQIVAFVTSSFILPIYGTGITLFYYDQRVRKEGFDIEWMMQAAGLHAAAPSELPVSAAPPEEMADTPQAAADEAEQQAHGTQS